MSAPPEVRIGRLVVEGRVLSQAEAERFARMVAEAIGQSAPATSATTGKLTVAVPATASLERLAARVAADIRRQLA